MRSRCVKGDAAAGSPRTVRAMAGGAASMQRLARRQEGFAGFGGNSRVVAVAIQEPGRRRWMTLPFLPIQPDRLLRAGLVSSGAPLSTQTRQDPGRGRSSSGPPEQRPRSAVMSRPARRAPPQGCWVPSTAVVIQPHASRLVPPQQSSDALSAWGRPIQVIVGLMACAAIRCSEAVRSCNSPRWTPARYDGQPWGSASRFRAKAGRIGFCGARRGACGGRGWGAPSHRKVPYTIHFCVTLQPRTSRLLLRGSASLGRCFAFQVMGPRRPCWDEPPFVQVVPGRLISRRHALGAVIDAVRLPLDPSDQTRHAALAGDGAGPRAGRRLAVAVPLTITGDGALRPRTAGWRPDAAQSRWQAQSEIEPVISNSSSSEQEGRFRPMPPDAELGGGGLIDRSSADGSRTQTEEGAHCRERGSLRGRRGSLTIRINPGWPCAVLLRGNSRSMAGLVVAVF